MYQGTTPTIPIEFEDIDLTEAKIYLTLEEAKSKKQVTFVSGEDFTVRYDGKNTVGDIHLTQEQTLDMNPGNCTVQARFVFPDEEAGVTESCSIYINPVLLKEVIYYE